MKGSRLLVSTMAACMIAVLLAAVPASADPPATIFVSGVNTGVSPTCHRDGTGAAGQRATWRNIADQSTYDFSTLNPTAWTCAQSIFAFLTWQARNQETTNATLVDQLRAALFTGTPNLTDPYEVLLNDLYITEPALSALSITADGSPAGLGSCKLQHDILLIRCADDLSGRIMLRDQYGNPISIGGVIQYIQLNGLLSVWGGGLTYGSTFIENYNATHRQTFDYYLEHHEQVHSQQWAVVGWQFANYYLGQQSTSLGNALNYLVTWGPVNGIVVPSQCFVTYERDAGFMDGYYSWRTADRMPEDQWPYNLVVTGNNVTGATQPWPTAVAPSPNPFAWTEARNESYPRCPSNWT